MKEYDAVFRNLRTKRELDRSSWSYTPVPEPKWLAWVGGLAAGCVFALMFYLGV